MGVRTGRAAGCAVSALLFCGGVAAQAPANDDSLLRAPIASPAAPLAPRVDSLAPPRVYTTSPSALDGPVTYSMRDSMRYDVAAQTITLYGEATVAFEDVTLTAGRMTIDNRDGIVTAEPALDSAGREVERPSFSQGPQTFTARGLRYNFNTRKGVVYNATTQQGDLYVLGGRTKIVAADPDDPARVDNTVYNSDAIITTCDHERPHYGIRSNKQKVIPNKQVIVGPSQVELGGVPTPLWLPFGFFPIGSSERSGLIFPTDYTYTDVDGFGFQQVGWYFPWNERWHSSLTADIFLRGTLRLNAVNTYNARYRYSGSADVGFASNRRETVLAAVPATDTTPAVPRRAEEFFEQSIAITWSHVQDRKANPYRNFRANVNFQTGDYARDNRQDYASQVTNIFRSNLGYTFRFPDHPTWNLTAGLDHSQNTNTGQVTINFPQLRFSTGALYPFAALGNSPTAWYKKAVVNYTAQARGTLQGVDSVIYSSEGLRGAEYGGQHSATFTAPVTVAKYFRLSPNVGVTQTFFADRVTRRLVRTLAGVDTNEIVFGGDTLTTLDSTFVDAIETETRRGFDQAVALTQANLSLSTQVYGTARFRLGPLRGIRHIVTPSVNIGYSPDYSRAPFNYYDAVLDDPDGLEEPFLRFPTRPFSAGSLPDEMALRVGYSLNNRLETKVLGRADSAATIKTLLNAFTLAGSYNLAADSLRWSSIRMSGGQVTLFDNILRVGFGGTLDIYAVDDAGRRFDETLLSRGEGLVRIETFNFRLGVQATLRQLRDLALGERSAPAPTEIFSLVEKFRLSYNFTRTFRGSGANRGWNTGANSINVNTGQIAISPKWSIRALTVGYDVRTRRLTYPSLSLGRDLHCWEMDFFWAPRLSTFTFSIRVKPSSLGFLELPYRRGSRF